MEELKIDPDNPDKEVISWAAQAILQGKIVAFPTDTVYGLGVNLFRASAVERIYQMKGRPKGKGLVALIAFPEETASLAREISGQARQLIERFWPGALTLVFHAKPEAPPHVTRKKTIGIRLPNCVAVRALIAEAGVPLASTSANLSGSPSARNARSVRESLEGKIDLLLDGDSFGSGIESTVVDVTISPPKILRKGAIGVEEIKKVIGEVR